MSYDIHTIAVAKGTTPARKDRVIQGWGTNANAAGSGAGVAVTITVTPGGSIQPGSVVVIDPRQDATWYTTNYTTTTFDVVLTPRLAANTLAAGTFAYHLVA